MASFPELKLEALLARLARADVDFVVVGGVAVAFQGYGRATKDLDITYATDPKNLVRLGEVLVALHARLRGVPEAVPFTPPYATMRARADRVDLGGIMVAVAALDDLLAMKRAAGRPQDLVDIDARELARRVRAESRDH